MLQLSNICIERAGKTLLQLDDLSIAAGEVVTLMGPSGSGKSTLLNYLLGDPLPEFVVTGSVTLAGVELTTLPAAQRRLGVCFQQPWLFPHLNVRDNLLFALPRTPERNGVKSKVERLAVVNEQLAALGLAQLAEQMPATLSGGQAARVALLRALISQPLALLLDEPFSALDQSTRRQVRAWTFDQLAQRQLPTLLVSHDEQDIYPRGRVINIGQPQE